MKQLRITSTLWIRRKWRENCDAVVFVIGDEYLSVAVNIGADGSAKNRLTQLVKK